VRWQFAAAFRIAAQGISVRECHRPPAAATTFRWRWDPRLQPEIYSVGIGCSVDNIKQKWDYAEQHQEPPSWSRSARLEIVAQGAALNQPGKGWTGCRFHL
jgi:hypothetical protein